MQVVFVIERQCARNFLSDGLHATTLATSVLLQIGIYERRFSRLLCSCGHEKFVLRERCATKAKF